jgi:hypothetical protein
MILSTKDPKGSTKKTPWFNKQFWQSSRI